MGSAIIAYSGGVDSTFLCAVARQVLGEKALAVTAVSPTYKRSELAEAIRLAKIIGIKHKTIQTEELSDKRFSSNPPTRCYYCKKKLFGDLKRIAKKKGIRTIIDASNADDLKDFRPGSKAAKELGIRSPLQEAAITKSEIRELSKKMRLPTWNRPSAACLASRLPYGEKIDRKKLDVVEKGENFLSNSGFVTVRARYHGDTVRIELGKNEKYRIFKSDIMESVVKKFKGLGFKYITLDLEGFRSGSMNEVLTEKTKGKIK